MTALRIYRALVVLYALAGAAAIMLYFCQP